jgi:hypothetical protein
MQSDRLQLMRASTGDAVNLFRECGVTLSDNQVVSLLTIIGLVGDPDDKIEIWNEVPNSPRGSMALILPNTYCNINVKQASLTAAAVILDALATSGLAIAALSLSGLAKQGVAKLDPESGEYCCLVHSVKRRDLGQAVTPQGVQGMISGKPCPFFQLHCRLMLESDCNCNATIEDIGGLFEELKEKGALNKQTDGWCVPL